MSRDIGSPPTEWAGETVRRVPGSPDPGVFVDVHGDTIQDIWLWHWHQPTNGDHRWHAAGVGLHTLHSLEPLHLEPSLGCEDGCPNHGWIRNGQWVPAG